MERYFFALTKIVVILVTLFPIVWFLELAFKTTKEAFEVPPLFFFEPKLDGFINTFMPWGAFKGVHGLHVLNSTIIAGFSTLAAIIVAFPAAYAFSRFRFKAKGQMFFFLLFVNMLPAITLLIAIYIMMRHLGLLDTHFGLILAYLSWNVPFAIWLLRGFVEEVPIELEEAAMVEGCSRISALARIVLPLCKAGVAVTGILCFIFSWNEFIIALMLSSGNTYTIQVGLSMFHSAFFVGWDRMGAVATVSLIPPLLVSFIFKRYIVRGLTLGAVKG